MIFFDSQSDTGTKKANKRTCKGGIVEIEIPEWLAEEKELV